MWSEFYLVSSIKHSSFRRMYDGRNNVHTYSFWNMFCIHLIWSGELANVLMRMRKCCASIINRKLVVFLVRTENAIRRTDRDWLITIWVVIVHLQFRNYMRKNGNWIHLDMIGLPSVVEFLMCIMDMMTTVYSNGFICGLCKSLLGAHN